MKQRNVVAFSHEVFFLPPQSAEQVVMLMAHCGTLSVISTKVTEDKWGCNGESYQGLLNNPPMVTRDVLQDDMANTSDYNRWASRNWHPLRELRAKGGKQATVFESRYVSIPAKMFPSLPKRVQGRKGTAAPQQSIKPRRTNKPSPRHTDTHAVAHSP